MIKKVDNLILRSKDSDSKLLEGLIAIAEKIRLNSKIDFISIDLDELESIVKPEKVGDPPSFGKIEVDI